MTALPKDVVADLRRRVAELEQQLQSTAAERDEAIAQQAATAEILQVINSSPADLAPVFEAILDKALRLCGAQVGVFWTYDGETMRASAIRGASPAYVEFLQRGPHRPSQVQLRLIAGAEGVVQVADVIHSEGYRAGDPLPRAAADLGGIHTLLVVPLRRQGSLLGTFGIYRQEVKPFSDRQIALVQSFAAQAVIAMENARLFNQTREALERQTATAEILKVIASSPSDVQPVFAAIATSSNRLVGGFSTAVFRFVDGVAHLAAFTPTANPAADEVLRASFPRPVIDWKPFEFAQAGEVIQVADTETSADVRIKQIARARGFRSMLFSPLMNKGTLIGTISVTRVEPGTFSDHHVQLLRTFADQAVIAIENVRLFDEVQAKTRDLSEALTYQTGSSNILTVIASSPTEVAPVLKAIVESASELCEAYDAAVVLKDGDDLRFSAHHGPIPIGLEKWPINRNWTAGRAFVDRKPVHVHDLLSSEGDDFPEGREMSRRMGHRSILSVPLLREGESIGTIVLRRSEVNPFTDKQIALLQTFADQAVIAIGNVRLFEEVQARTEDLRESLQFQTATSDVLKVISSSPDSLQPVLDVIVDTSRHLCGTETSTIFLLRDRKFHIAAASGAMPAYLEFLQANPIALDQAGSSTSRAAREKRTVHIPDIGADPEFGQGPMAVGQRRALLSVPLMHEGTAIGVITMRQSHLTPFTERQIEVVQTFADQAVIAISNVRLFEEVQARTRDLTESLQQQTATADVLKVISRSAFDLQAVLDTLVESAAKLCEADMAAITRRTGDVYYRAGSYGFPPEFAKYAKDIPVPPGRSTITGRALLEGGVVHVEDVLADTEYDFEGQQLSGNPRTFLGVPLLREGKPVGAIVLARRTVRPFAEKQIELVRTFADQAVIAIENVRLFDEVQAKTRELTEALPYQTGSSNILSVIASSPTDVAPVLKAIVDSARELCDAYDAAVLLSDGDQLRFCAHHGPIPISFEKLPINRNWTAGRAFVDRKPIHVHDLLAEGDEFPLGQELSQRMGHRSILSVPLLREGESIGTIVLRRTEVHPFSEKQIALLETFADQAVIAIGNVRLFEQVQARTRELSKSLEDLRTAQDRLVQVHNIASLGHHSAGIDHDI